MILGVIPARFASTRFPAKPLVDIQGKSMIRRVYEQAQQAAAVSSVIVATDDKRILSHVQGFGGQAEMTGKHHRSGTERVAEVAARHTKFDYIVNIQGDEPFIAPQQIDLLCQTLTLGPDVQIATLIKQIEDPATLFSPHIVKVVTDHLGYALYFSRSPIPFCRGVEDAHEWLKHNTYYKHIGIYGFSRKALLAVGEMKPSQLEAAESLEQLRWLANGYRIRTARTEHETLAVDTPEDLQRLLNSL